MIMLQEVFENLARGEFSNLALHDPNTGSIKEDKYPVIVSALNRGLREIYKRFLLKQKECLIYQQADVEIYYLRSYYLVTDVPGTNKYIASSNSEDVFDDDVIKVIGAYDEDQLSYPLNDPRRTGGIFTQAYDTFKWAVPVAPDPLQNITLVYQATYPKIIIPDVFVPKTFALYIPDFIEDALMNYVASALIKSKTTKATENVAQKHNTYDYKFEAACQLIKNNGFAEEHAVDRNRFDNDGWV